MYPEKKRAQVTFFIVLGIILLIILGLFFYFRGQQTTEAVEAQVQQAMREVPVVVQPVKNYVEQCLQTVGREGLEKLAFHGGFLALTADDPEFVRAGFFQSLEVDITGLRPTEADAFKVREGWFVPYWHHLSTKNDGSEGVAFSSHVPLLDMQTDAKEFHSRSAFPSIQRQMEAYVAAKLPDCLNNFMLFEQQGMDIEITGEPHVSVSIPRKGVVLLLTLPLRIKAEEGTQNLNQFRTELDVNLRDLYEYVLDIFEVMYRSQSMDQVVRNVVSGYGSLEGDIPPMYADEIGFAPRMWVQSSVEEKLKELFEANIKKLRVMGSLGEEYDSNQIFQEFGDLIRAGQLTNLYTLRPTLIRSGYDVSFTYSQDWPLYLFIAPGGVISSTDSGVGIGLLSFLGFQRYQLPFDVSLPVLVEVTDPTAFRGEGFTLFFGMEGNMRNNEIIQEGQEEARSRIRLPPSDTGEVHLCDMDQRNSGDITIEVVGSDGRPVDNAAISFISSTKCPIANTKIENRKSIFAGKLPIGIGGIEVNHPDYLTTKVPFTTKLHEPDSTKIIVPKFVDTVVSAKKYLLKKRSNIPLDIDDYDKDEDLDEVFDINYIRNPVLPAEQQWIFNRASLHELRPQERLIINAERMKDSPLDPDYQTLAIIQGDGKANMRLVPGTYKLTMTLMYNAPYTIPTCPECICKSVDDTFLIGGDCERWSDLEGKELDTVAESSIVIQHTFGDEIYEDGTIMFRTIAADFPGVPEQRRMLKDMGIIDHIQKRLVPQHAEKLKPKLIRQFI